MKNKATNSQLVFELLKFIPKGKVVSYGFVSDFLGIGSPRVIGNILHKNELPETYPCHRVIKNDGTVASGYAFGGEGVQQKLLEQEGIVFIKGGTDFNKFGWICGKLAFYYFQFLKKFGFPGKWPWFEGSIKPASKEGIANKPVFIVDAYTKMFYTQIIGGKSKNYQDLQTFFAKNLPVDLAIYQNYHALIVRWAQFEKHKIIKSP